MVAIQSLFSDDSHFEFVVNLNNYNPSTAHATSVPQGGQIRSMIRTWCGHAPEVAVGLAYKSNNGATGG